ncbi:MAG TPA: hypothetical protein DEB39_08960 [Planctomycetaceae bacterium]|nr:hypothetical protein [Planctomycetaceae bacterium]
MEPLKFTEQFKYLLETIIHANERLDAAGILIFLEGSLDWARLRRMVGEINVILAASRPEVLAGAQDHGFKSTIVKLGEGTTVNDRLAHAILDAVVHEYLPPGTRIIALYSGFDPNVLDSISVINLVEHLDRLSGRDLRQLDAKVPLKTLKLVVDLAVEVGSEGREGKAVGTLFVVGDTRRVLAQSKPAGFDPVRGYQRSERNLADAKVREGIKEIAQLDGALIIAPDATVVAACRYLDTDTATITLSKGLGARHWAAAAISRTTGAIAIAVSQSSGTVRIFQNGECALRVEARYRRPMVWKDSDPDE